MAEIGLAHPDVATVMVTGHDEPELAETALQLGAYGYLTKPFRREPLLIQVTNALRRRELETARSTYEEGLQEMVATRTADLEVVVGRLEDRRARVAARLQRDGCAAQQGDRVP